MRRFLKFVVHAAVVGLFVSLAVVWSGPAVARTAPETLADAKPVQPGVVEVAFPIDYVGVLWDLPPGAEHAEDAGEAEPHGAVRFRHHGQWGAWVELTEDGIQGRHQWASGLVSARDADAYQIRGLPLEARRPRAVAINTTDGRPVTVAQADAGTAQALTGRCRSRADWGADEALRHDAAGNEIWPPEFHQPQAMTVHHTATTNDDPDPAATVRAIYRYHAVDQGWGDIGYQYLVDEAGVVYEGRWSGADSPSCDAGGTGDEFAHDEVSGKLVTGAHTGGWNSGNAGTALLGEFTTHRRFGAEPKPAAVSSLEDLLADLAVRHGLDPLAEVLYTNPVSGEQKLVQTIAGHRDYQATECPGQRLYDLLPTIRQNVDATMGSSTDSTGTDSTGTVGSVHVGDLDGTASVQKNQQWSATVTATALSADGQPVEGIAVEGTWTTTGAAATCTTGAGGTCSVSSALLSKNTGSATFRVDALRGDGWTYDATGNTDPDGDSDGTTITVSRGG